MVKLYIEDIEAYIGEIQLACASNDITGAVRPAHTIKSTSKRMGALKLAEMAKDIELAARETQNIDEIQTKLDEMTPVFEKTRASLISK